VEEQTDQGGYGTASEYIRQLIRAERKRRARVQVEEKLREALDGGEPKVVTDATWKESDRRVKDRINAASKKRRANGETH
jgi:antitoxin ParD1/3/4